MSHAEPRYLRGVDELGSGESDCLRCLACGDIIWEPEADRAIWGRWRGYFYADLSKCTFEIAMAYQLHARKCFAMKRLIVMLGKERI